MAEQGDWPCLNNKMRVHNKYNSNGFSDYKLSPDLCSECTEAIEKLKHNYLKKRALARRLIAKLS